MGKNYWIGVLAIMPLSILTGELLVRFWPNYGFIIGTSISLAFIIGYASKPNE